MTSKETKIDPVRLRTFRVNNRLTQDELSQAAGLSLRTVQRAEKIGAVSFSTLKSLAAVFEIDAVELEADEGFSRSTPPAAARYGLALAAGISIMLLAIWLFADQNGEDFTKAADFRETVAVLSFVALTREAQSAADALTHDLTLALDQGGLADILPERNTRSLSTNAASIDEIGQLLSVSVIVEGSVRLNNNRVRVTVQAIDVGSEAHLWSETYDRNSEDIGQILPAVVRSVEATYRSF